MNFAGEKLNLTPEELLNLITGGKGGKAVIKNAIDNPLDTLLGGEGSTEKFKDIDWKGLLTGGRAGNFVDDLQSGKFNYSNQEGVKSLPDSTWNYNNMGKAIADEKAEELEKINQLLGLPATRGTFLE